MEDRIIVKNIRGLETAWVECGDENGPILLFLHGYPDTPEAWRFQIDHFKTRYHVVAPFARGVRPSQKAQELSRYGSDAALLDHLEILKAVDPDRKKSVVVVGHDLGSVHAWNLAPLLGKSLGALVIINGASIQQMVKRFRNPAQQKRSWYVYAFLMPMLADRFVKHYPAKLLNMAHNSGQLSVAKRPSLGASLPGVVNPIRQYRAFALEIARSIKAKPLKVKAPALVIYGNRDPFLVAPTANELKPFAKNCTIRILEGGHWLHRDNPEEVNLIVDQFISETGRP